MGFSEFHVTAIVPAGGRGTRFGTSIPKQFIQIKNRPILFYCLRQLENAPDVSEIIIPVHVEWQSQMTNWIKEWKFQKISHIIAGGPERQDSVARALEVLSPHTQWILVHDAVRPLISLEKIHEVVEAGYEYGAAILAIPSRNTIKRCKEGWVEETVDRETFWQVQTPQVFRREVLVSAYKKALEQGFYGTDDAMLVERLGHPVRVVLGEEQNIKITTAYDMQWVEMFLQKENP